MHYASYKPLLRLALVGVGAFLFLNPLVVDSIYTFHAESANHQRSGNLASMSLHRRVASALFLTGLTQELYI
jgi:hypothetical protein